MSMPVVVVLSRDAGLNAELPELLRSQADVRHCDTQDEVLDLTRHIRPQAVVADFRRAAGGGFVEQKLVDTLRQRFPEVRIGLLAGEHCPELIARSASDGGLPLVRGVIDRNELLKFVGQLIPLAEGTAPDPAPVQEVAPVASAPAPVRIATAVPVVADRPASVLSGVTRRFETSSPELQQMLADLEVAARHDVTILLIGETGAGKTFLSRLIHEVSPRKDDPFLPVACGALPNDLIESELFGHVKGSFTSAHADKEGKFVAARRGSILLDEIDVLGLEQQVKLLRVIETGEFEPVGSNQTQRCEARLIVASNLELQPLVEQHKFRPDLYYRLNMLKFVIPPLRHRKMDIIPLAKRFIAQFSVKHGTPIHEIDADMLQALLDYPWPGNVRELEHVMQRAVIYSRDGHIGREHLPVHILSGHAGPVNDASVILGHHGPAETPVPSPKSLGGKIALTERDIIEQTLLKNSFSRTRSARELGISRVTLYNKMKRYGLMS
jgi:two-component system, NtrC family, response regulator AtoC